jgi:hypothetical protein
MDLVNYFLEYMFKMTKNIIGKRKTQGIITMPIKDLIYFEIGSYYTIQQKPFSTRYNRIRWVSDKKLKTYVDMYCCDIKYKNDVAFVYFENVLILK